MMEKRTPSGYVETEYHPAWLEDIAPERFNNTELFRIVTFFVFHLPCCDLSAMSRSLLYYNWDSPWRKPQSLRKRLISESTNPHLLFSAEARNDFLQATEKAGLVDFPKNKECESIAIVNNKRTQFISVFAHLRDSFAHGRLNMYDIGAADDYVFAFEDVAKNKKKNRYEVTARMILRKSTLLKWIDLIEHGYTEQ